jgi:hypothetical protein
VDSRILSSHGKMTDAARRPSNASISSSTAVRPRSRVGIATVVNDGTM